MVPYLAKNISGSYCRLRQSKEMATLWHMSTPVLIITLRHGGEYFPSAVGEVNVVQKMKEQCSNWGEGMAVLSCLIFITVVALIRLIVLSHLANHRWAQNSSVFVPGLFYFKNKIEVNNGVDKKRSLKIKRNIKIHNTRWIKIEFDDDWYLRTSELIIRIYAWKQRQTTY
jgi:phosphomannomutase